MPSDLSRRIDSHSNTLALWETAVIPRPSNAAEILVSVIATNDYASDTIVPDVHIRANADGFAFLADLFRHMAIVASGEVADVLNHQHVDIDEIPFSRESGLRCSLNLGVLNDALLPELIQHYGSPIPDLSTLISQMKRSLESFQAVERATERDRE